VSRRRQSRHRQRTAPFAASARRRVPYTWKASSIVSGLHRLLLGLLVLGCLQILVGVVALRRSRRSRRSRLVGAPSHARYAREHGALLLGGAVVLMVPIALGLAGVVAESSAFYAAVALEVIALPFARMQLRRSEAAHLARRPA
jgi:hypothetical protein